MDHLRHMSKKKEHQPMTKIPDVSEKWLHQGLRKGSKLGDSTLSVKKTGFKGILLML